MSNNRIRAFLVEAKRLEKLVNTPDVSWNTKNNIAQFVIQKSISETGIYVYWSNPGSGGIQDSQAYNEAVQKMVPDLEKLESLYDEE